MGKEVVYTYDILPECVKTWADTCVHLVHAKYYNWTKQVVDCFETDIAALNLPFTSKANYVFTCKVGSKVVGEVVLSLFKTESVSELDLGTSFGSRACCLICPYDRKGTYVFEQMYFNMGEPYALKDYLYKTSRQEILLSIVNALYADKMKDFQQSTQESYGFEEKD